MAEWSIAAVLKTVELRGSGGSNPSLSATKKLDNATESYSVAFLFCGGCVCVQAHTPHKTKNATRGVALSNGRKSGFLT